MYIFLMFIFTSDLWAHGAGCFNLFVLLDYLLTVRNICHYIELFLYLLYICTANNWYLHHTATCSHTPSQYPFIHIGGEEQCRVKVLLRKNNKIRVGFKWGPLIRNQTPYRLSHRTAKSNLQY